MIRVVIDTSVLIRYLIRPSAAIRTLIEVLWLEDVIQLVTAPDLVTEFEEVLAYPKIRRYITPEDGHAILDAILLKAEILATLGAVPSFTRDPKDDKFVACALAGHVDYLITVDKDLLVLQTLGDVRIMTPYEFIEMQPDLDEA